MASPASYTQRIWHLVNARNQPVGRLASQIVPLLTGKYKPTYTPNYDCGDYVVVVNASSLKFTGKKTHDKLYHRHTGYPGGLKTRTARELLELKPEEVLRKAVLGMITRNNLRHGYIEPKLRIYRDHLHPHTKQIKEGVPPLPQVPRKLMENWHPVLGFKNEYKFGSLGEEYDEEGDLIGEGPEFEYKFNHGKGIFVEDVMEGEGK